MKRCKNCAMWQPYRGNEPTIPGRARNACQLHLGLRKTTTGKLVRVPTFNPKDEPGPHCGKRTEPNFVCQFFVAKKPPRVKPKT